MARSESNHCFKILLIGNSSVGKTSLMFRFANNKFTETFTPTIGLDFVTTTLHIRDKKVKLQLWDTAGQEKFFNMTRSFYRSADAILLVYDRSEASSFKKIGYWMRNIDENAPSDVIRVLVGNKSDLHHRLVISTKDGQRLADQSGIDFFETSVKTDSHENISQIFYSITEKLLDKYPSTSKPSTIKIKESKNLLDSSYGNLVSCCSSTTTIFK